MDAFHARPYRPDDHPHSQANEETPLLCKPVSFIVPNPSSRANLPDSPSQPSCSAEEATVPRRPRPSFSNNSIKLAPNLPNVEGRSTYGQTLFNCIAILLGIGMLSEPLAFAYAGWIGGTALIVFFGYITCYTAKILAHVILDDPRLRSYADVGKKAFGPRSTLLTSFLFCLEVFSVGVVLVTLAADSLHSVVPTYSANTYKMCSLIVLLPTVFVPLSVLSYTSVLGIVSTILVVAVLFIDGLSKTEGPGSLWDPAETSIGVGGLTELGMAFGLFMAGFSGHAAMPSLARDMIDPSQFDHMIDRAYIIAVIVYAVIGWAGYVMFGTNVSDEVSGDLLATPGYNPVLNKVMLWMLVISPLTKYALATRPLNVILEVMLGLEGNTHGPAEDSNHEPKPAIRSKARMGLKRVLVIVERGVIPFLSVAVSILIPEFSSMMAFLGSFSAFVICVIGPISAKSSLAGHWTFFDASILVIAVIMAAWGTYAAFLTA
ncbi:hypothetical protein CONPUDRAFT_44089 [Coniophora puteana RWD-64-598 SS2]|uniref:Amino acid transporter transmembrane domain-containing protein n=1 Tax=Coniophora puteana (strain RWD-64-598) TaxID=741705 RepID=A0A5M3N6S7_CONPW|nr:uncharacterized protein CONPUDRAFT_44089 [Coniophora puteana RWD-64-598 SS2]EIW86561.1 hypothetical protein CONPUDRAFT_44089 [Coniophora puteana RWD-64-598 SS2]